MRVSSRTALGLFAAGFVATFTIMVFVGAAVQDYFAEEPVVEEEVVVEEEPPIAVWPAGKHSFGIFSYSSFAHGCAVNGKTLTNRHVVDDPETHPLTPHEPRQILFRYTFSRGIEGYGKSVLVSIASDLAVVELDQPVPNYAALATEAPSIGETLLWVEHDFSNKENAFAVRYRKSEVARVKAGNIILKAKITPGASGGCVYNGAGEVVGLMAWGMATKDYSQIGGVIGIWGKWWEFDNKPFKLEVEDVKETGGDS